MTTFTVNQILPNGATVLAFFEGQGGIVLARRDGAYQPFVTWFYNPGHSESTTWGHYFDDYNEAWEDFVSRVNKEGA